MLKMENVRKNYRDFELNCSMEVQKGCITGLIGPNGAGKCTAFKAALNLIRTDGVRIMIMNKPATELTAKDREAIGVVLADSGFSGYLSIEDLLPMLRSMYSQFEEVWFLEKCKEFQLPLKKQIKEFSTGMKRKLQVLAALSHNARLLILDEPTAGMDVIARDAILNLLREYMEQNDRTILISSHISSDLEGFCDDLYMIDGGNIVLHEETDVLLSEYGVLKVTQQQFEKLDQSYILRHKKEEFGYTCLTNQKQFYSENYPEIVIEKGTIDELIMMMIRGEK